MRNIAETLDSEKRDPLCQKTESLGGEFCIAQADARDVPAIAAVFTECFQDSVLHYCGSLPKPQAMEDVFRLVYEAEPAAAFVAKAGGEKAAGDKTPIIGYCFAPRRLSRLWLLAVARGHVFRWAWRWLSGQYGFGLHPVKIILLNKLAFLRSAVHPAQAIEARILSIAVTSAWRGRGVAAALMAAAMDRFEKCGVRRVRLEVRPDNIPAVRLYRRFGYAGAGETFDSQGPWLIMIWERCSPNV